MFKTQYKINDSYITQGKFVIKYRKWWCPFYLMYGNKEYVWKEVLKEIKRLEEIEG